MGDIAVDAFLNTLKQLIRSSKLDLVIDEKHQLESLEEEIKYLRKFLMATEKIRNKYSNLKKLAMEIRNVVSEVEDIVEIFEFNVSKVGNPCLDLENVRKKIKTLTTLVKQIYNENMWHINGVAAVNKLNHSSIGSGGGYPSVGSNTSKPVEEKVVLGFNEEVEGVINKLNGGEGEPLEIITIHGTGGCGKTTLAREVYHHSSTRYTFEIRAWVDVSQGYNNTMKTALLNIILKSAPRDDHNHTDASDREEELGEVLLKGDGEEELGEVLLMKKSEELGEVLFKRLRNRKYLIVLDDIWGLEIWNDLQRSFPRDCNGSKILFTSRFVAQPDNVKCIPHYLGYLTKTLSWELLRNEVFGIESCPKKLEGIGQRIAEKCEGLPLAIVIIAGILKRKDRTCDVWEEVAEHLIPLIAKNEEGCMKALELSYNDLPPCLKACFIYIGAFPEDYEISKRELIWLWIAEGFIQSNDGEESLEAIANNYLLDLVGRNLIMIAHEKFFGEIKAIRMHDLLRELCLRKAEEENFCVKINEDDSPSPPATGKYGRLIIDSRLFHKGFVRPISPNLRSILCFVWRNCSCLERTTLFLVENSKLLRVLSVNSTRFSKLKRTEHLECLRYLAFQGADEGLDDPFTYLLNLEVINIKGGRRANIFQLPFNIFKLKKLRHIYWKRGVFAFHVSSQGPRVGHYNTIQMDSLQTLHRICGCYRCLGFLKWTPNLRKLGIAVPVTGYSVGNGMICNLESLKCLETFKFTTHSYGHHRITRCKFPPELKLPSTVTRVSLERVDIIWEELSALQTLPKLEVLKIRRCHCEPALWDTTSEEGFSQLKYLKLANVKGIMEWNASEDQFPRLEVLVIKNCKQLNEIPVDFANLCELREINLKGCHMSLAISALGIQEEQKENIGDDGCLELHAKDIFSDGEAVDSRFVMGPSSYRGSRTWDLK